MSKSRGRFEQIEGSICVNRWGRFAQIEGVDLHKSRGRFQINGVELQIEWVDLQIDPSICANRGGRFVQIDPSISNRGGRFAPIDWVDYKSRGRLQIDPSNCANRGVDLQINHLNIIQRQFSNKIIVLFENCLCMILRWLICKSTPRFAQFEGSICNRPLDL